MEQIQKATIKKAILMLQACNCEFAIIDPDGKTHGNLVVEVPKKRSPNKYHHGELRKYIKPYLDELSPGQVAVIPVGPYDLTSLQSSVSSAACILFGNESCTTSRNRENNTVEILRIV